MSSGLISTTWKVIVWTIYLFLPSLDISGIFTFNKRLFPDVKKMNSVLQDKGFHTVFMIDPGVKKENGYAIYDQVRFVQSRRHPYA